MGMKDTVTKDYMKDNRVFADAFNHLIYGGEQVIVPEKLHPLDTTAIGTPYGADGAVVPVQKFRDGFKFLTAMEDDSMVYLLLGIENQAEIQYAMPVKDMVYDALEYAAQVEKAAKSHRQARKVKKEEKKLTDGEYLTGFYKEDRLVPVVTLVLFFSPEEWDAPVCLHDMFAVKDQRILSFVPDYKINLVAPASMSDKEINQFATNLREVMLFIKYSRDKEKLNDILTKDEGFKSVELKAARVINTVTGSGLELNESEATVDMCLAIDEMRKEERDAGIQQGIQQGMQQGARIKTVELIERMLELGEYSYEQIANVTNVSAAEIKEIEAKKAVLV